MMVKYIDKYTVEYPSNPLYVGDRVISNPTDETLRSLGYKDLVEQDYPEGEGYYTPTYTDGEVITQGWEAAE